MKVSIPIIPVDRKRLARVLSSEFDAWVHNFGRIPIPEAQDLRAFLVQWLAVFAPECFEPPLVEDILTFAHETRQHPKFNRDKWFEVVSIEVALFVLTSDPFWIQTARLNLNHHNYALRSFVQKSILLVVDKIRFDDPEWLAPVDDNLKARHLGSADNVLFLCMAQGDSEMKKTYIKGWLDNGNISPHDHAQLQAFSNNWYAVNPFLHDVARSACYILLRMSCKGDPVQQDLFPDILEREVLKPPDERKFEIPLASELGCSDLGAIIWERMNGHPVFQSHIHISED